MGANLPLVSSDEEASAAATPIVPTPSTPPPPGPENQAPDAVADSFETQQGEAVSGNVLPNDSDPDGDTLTVTGNTDPANGTVTVDADGSFTYTPPAGAPTARPGAVPGAARRRGSGPAGRAASSPPLAATPWPGPTMANCSWSGAGPRAG